MGPTEKKPADARADLDSTGEFFSVGTPLHAVRAGYIHRRADDQLYDVVKTGQYAHVLAPERSGKTSLISATAARLESHGWKVAILDLGQIGDRDGGTDAGRWYYSVAYRLLRQLRIRFDLLSWWQDKSILSNRQRLCEFYSEVILQHVSEPVVVFVDEIQCMEDLPHADQLLTSIRAAHNARTTDPDFSRLCFVLSGECDPVSLMQQAEVSPFNVTQQILLDDFSRRDLNLFATELNRPQDMADAALDRIYFWTAGQPYLTQKLARAVAREAAEPDVEAQVDRIAIQQLAGRAALHSEPHMSHIHRAIVNDEKRCEALLNLYGKIRKGIEVPADLGSPVQRRLMAVGLLVIDDESNLCVRNRLYETVFTARWANENLPTHFKVPAIVIGVLLLFVLIPFAYTQWLPIPYVRVLASDTAELERATEAYENFRSFPGHADSADNLFRNFLERRAQASDDEVEIGQIAMLAADLPNAGRLADEVVAAFWDRRASGAIRREDREGALLAGIRALESATAPRRQRAASLISDDYPLLLATIPEMDSGSAAFDPLGMVLTTASGAEISQYVYTPQGVQRRETWSITALEVAPLVRRVIVDREGTVGRIGLTLNISHARLADLRIKVIAPSGRTVEVEAGLERASDNDDIRIPSAQLAELIGESLSGTWSISLRDESLGVAGQLVGWNLKLNSQGAIEYFQRGLNIPDPVERETDNIWFGRSGRYAVARAAQSDSARVWDLAFAEPVGAVALPENESLVGLDEISRRVVTANQDSINLWDTGSGDKVRTIDVGSASRSAVLTASGTHVFVRRRTEAETELELWRLQDGQLAAKMVVAGAPSLLAVNAAGDRVAIADFDRAVRVWDLQTASLLGQFDLPAQPAVVELSADGSTLGVVYPDAGLSVWSVDNSRAPLLETLGNGNWQLAFSPSGKTVAAGRPATGFQLYSSSDGRRIGPPLGMRRDGAPRDILSFSDDEQILLTGSVDSKLRFWRTPVTSTATDESQQSPEHEIWSRAGDRPLLVSPDGSTIAIGDLAGHVHVLASGARLADVVAVSEDVSFVGHTSAVRMLKMDRSGSLIASVAADNSVRIWRAGNGEPLAFVVEVPGLAVTALDFSPDARFLGILNGTRVSIVEVSTGAAVAEYEAGSLFRGLTFAQEDALYVGTEDGALQLFSRADSGSWQLQQVWQGPQPIRSITASPRGDSLILVDQTNLASQFILAEGRIGEATLQLPSEVSDVTFAPNGTRAYFRTARWVHRVSAAASGLLWADAALVPPALNGTAIVHGNGQVAAARRVYVPVVRNGFVELDPVSFSGAGGTGLFGNKEELLREWRRRISADLPEAS